MNKKKGYVSVEALIITALITVVGFTVFISTRDALGLAAARTLGITYQLTQDMANKLESSFGYEGNPNAGWDTNSGNTIKNDVSTGQVPIQTITLNIPQTQSKVVGNVFSITATVTNPPIATGIVSWIVVSGSDNIVVTCTGASDCLTVNVTAINKGVSILRASVQNNSVFKDVIISIE